MKTIIIAIASITLSASSATTFAQETGLERSNTTTAQTVDYTSAASHDKAEIKREELPKAVLDVLDSDALAGTEFVSAYVSDEGGKKVYEVTLRKDDNDVVVKFDESGNILY